jgi:hypothetical protein
MRIRTRSGLPTRGSSKATASRALLPCPTSNQANVADLMAEYAASLEPVTSSGVKHARCASIPTPGAPKAGVSFLGDLWVGSGAGTTM